MKTLIAAILLISLTAKAQIAVYKSHISEVVNGHLETIRRTVSGNAIVDLQTGDVSIIYVATKAKTYHVYTESYTTSLVSGSGGKEFTIYSYFDDSTDADGMPYLDYSCLKGVNVQHQDIGDTNSLWSIPKTLSYSERFITQIDTTNTGLEEDSGTMTLDLKTTKIYNAQAFTIDEAISDITSKLDALGYNGKKLRKDFRKSAE